MRTLILLFAMGSIALAQQQTRVNVTVENMAPSQGTFQTPVWIGFHNGTFDTYTGGLAASDLPLPGSVAMERLAEDGNTGPLSNDFTASGTGTQQSTLAGPSGPLAPGDLAGQTFLLNNQSPLDRYFSYASMVIPSNDAFIANGNPLSHPIFDNNGNFIAQDFFVAGQNAVNDAGTEVNDEIPGNTAFFGQMAPNTGVTESGVVTTHPGFLPAGSGGILDDPRFRNGDFTLAGYPFLRVGFLAAPAVTEFRAYATVMTGAEEVPSRVTDAIGITGMALVDEGETLAITVVTLGLENLIFGHLHLGPAGSNGPVVATLIPNRGAGSGGGGFESVSLELRTGDLAGPLKGFPLDELIRRMQNNEIYVNLHTDDGVAGANTGAGDFIGGEIRGQVERFFPQGL